MPSASRTAIVALSLVVVAGGTPADPVIEIIDLRHLEAAPLAASFAPAEETAADDDLFRQQVATDFALGAMARGAALRPGRRPRTLPVEGVSGATTAPGRYADLSGLLPEGLEGPPVVAPHRNALILKGTRAALDEFREVLAMLDTPAPMVEIHLRLDELHQSSRAGWLPEMQAWGWGGEARAGGPPGGDTMVGFAVGNMNVTLGVLDQRGQRRGMTETRVTTTNSLPAIISVGEIRPWFAGEVWYDTWGRRHVEYFPYAVFTGVSLWVLPQVHPDDSVTMRLRPTLVEAGGRAADIGPGDVLHRTLMETVVRVPSGQSLVIGGMRRRLDAQNRRWPGTQTMESQLTDSVITVTPYVIRPMEGR